MPDQLPANLSINTWVNPDTPLAGLAGFTGAARVYRVSENRKGYQSGAPGSSFGLTTLVQDQSYIFFLPDGLTLPTGAVNAGKRLADLRAQLAQTELSRPNLTLASSVVAGQPITLTASLPVEASLQGIDFLVGGQVVSPAGNTATSFAYTPTVAGTYALTTRLTLTGGAVTTSYPQPLTVLPATTPPQARRKYLLAVDGSDSSGNNLPLSPSGAPLFPGAPENAAQLMRAQRQFFTSPYAAGDDFSQGLTAYGEFRLNGAVGQLVALAFYANNYQGPMLVFLSGNADGSFNLQGSAYTSGTTQITATFPAIAFDQRWHSYHFIYDPVLAKLGISLDGEPFVYVDMPSLRPASSDMTYTVGSATAAGDFFFDGFLRRAQLYNKVVTDRTLLSRQAVVQTRFPANAPVSAAVILTGQALDVAQEVYFGAGKGQILAQSDTTLTALVPASATVGQIRLTTLFGDVFAPGTFFPEVANVTQLSPAVLDTTIFSA